MLSSAIIKYRNHKILTAKEVQSYIQMIKDDEEVVNNTKITLDDLNIEETDHLQDY
jgi:hypothetical protein